MAEDVRGFLSNVSCVILHGVVHHRLAHLVSCAPDGPRHILLELHGVLFVFLFVNILVSGGASVHTAESFVVADVGGVAMSERAEHWRFHFLSLLFGELFLSAVRDNVVIESAVLTNDLAEGLITVDNLGVEACILVTVQVLLALEGIFAVTNVFELSKRLCSLAVVDARDHIGFFFRSLFLHVDVFAFADGAVTVHREERLSLGRGGGGTQLTIEFARVLIGVAEGV